VSDDNKTGVPVSDDDKTDPTAEPSSGDNGQVVVEIPQIDDEELSSFFIMSASVSEHKEEASVDTFNDIFIDSNDMYDSLTVVKFNY